MKLLISLSRGRDQAWFDGLDSGKKSEYLKAHPNSKFGDKMNGSGRKAVGKTQPANAEHESIKAHLAKLKVALGKELEHIAHLKAQKKINVEEIARVGRNIVRIRTKMRELRGRLAEKPKAAPAKVQAKPARIKKAAVESPVKVKQARRPAKPVTEKPVSTHKVRPAKAKPASHVMKHLSKDEQSSVNDALKKSKIKPENATADHVHDVAAKELKSAERKQEKATSVNDKHSARSLVHHWTNLYNKIKKIVVR